MASTHTSVETSPEIAALRPLDAHNETLQRNVHPPDWTNPAPADRYNLVVMGAGTAGLVAAAGTAGLGGRVALVERSLMGGDCLNLGCVPSKAIIRSGRAAAEARDASRFGVVGAEEAQADFGAVMERMRRLRSALSPHDAASRFRELGVDVFLGDARFTGPEAVEVAGQTLRFAKACVATGARATAPPIPGLEEAGYLTNETVFSLTELPPRLTVIGAGPIGCEMAQSFARLGSSVTLLEAGDRIMPRDDPDAAGRVHRALEADGVRLLCGGKSAQVETAPEGKRVRVGCGGETHALDADEILVAAGRKPNVDGLNLEAAGVSYDEKAGVHVDERLRSRNKRIFAAGDVASVHKFTHAADAMGRIVVQNAFFFGRGRVSDLTVPWCTYTEPELAHTGMTAEEAAERADVTTHTVDFEDSDRAVLEDETNGLLKVHADAKGRVLGGTLVSAHAGETISELTLAIQQKARLGDLSATVHPYPTQAEALKKAGDAFQRSKLTPRVQRLFAKWMAWRR